MRARGLFLALALLASACSSSAGPDQAGSDSSGVALVEPAAVEDPSSEGVVATEGEAASGEGATGRQLGEPSSESASGDSEENGDAPDGLAFDNQDREPSDDGSTESESEDDAGAEPDDLASPSDTPAPASDFDRLVDELIAFVEQERGYSFETRPSIELLDGAAFGAAWSTLIADDVAEHSTDYVNYTDIYRAMGVLDGDRSLEEIWQRFGDAGVIGFYNQDTGGITLRAGEVNAFTETVLVHELVHALEDQIFDLDRPEYDSAKSEVEWTFSALTEGSARRIETLYRQTFSAAKLVEETEARRSLPRTVSLTEFNASFLELQFGRYRHGESFASSLWSEGKDTLDAAFENPPATSEVVLDPPAYLAGVETSAVNAPPADGEVFESGVWGQAGWAAVLTDLTTQAEALEITDGWNGDSFVAWRQGDETCVRAHLAGDSPDDLDDYAAALEEWARIGNGREIFYPTADLIRITACG